MKTITYYIAGLVSLIAVPAFVVAQTATVTGLSCPVELSFMKMGADNTSADVAKLQTFLAVYEKADVDINGTFDEKTDAAVRDFQKKYMNDIMGPWDATRPSGIVRITTIKKINEIVCKTPLSLNENDLSAIAEYRKSIGSTPIMDVGSSAGPVQVVQPTDISSTMVLTATGTDTGTEATSYDISASTTASTTSTATSTTAGGRFWNFLKSLF